MNDYAVQVTLAPVLDGDWGLLRSVLDTVPGTVLIEDPETPWLSIPVEAKDPMRAAAFVDGLSKLKGLTIVSGSICPLADVDFELPEEDEAPVEPDPVAERVHDWVDSLPDITKGQGDGNKLIDA